MSPWMKVSHVHRHVPDLGQWCIHRPRSLALLFPSKSPRAIAPHDIPCRPYGARLTRFDDESEAAPAGPAPAPQPPSPSGTGSEAPAPRGWVSPGGPPPGSRP